MKKSLKVTIVVFAFCCIFVILLLLTYFLTVWIVTIVFTPLYFCNALILLLLTYFLAVWKVTIVVFCSLLYCFYSLIVDIFPDRLDIDNCFYAPLFL
jgi:hypothetical protein